MCILILGLSTVAGLAYMLLQAAFRNLLPSQSRTELLYKRDLAFARYRTCFAVVVRHEIDMIAKTDAQYANLKSEGECQAQ